MTSPLDGDQNVRGHYVGPHNPLITATAIVVAVTFLALIVLAVAAALAFFWNLVFYGGHQFKTVYFWVLVGCFLLFSVVLYLESHRE